MEKGINLYLSKNIDDIQLLDMIAKAGFDSIILPFSFIENYKERALEIVQSYGLKVQMIHSRYNAKQLDLFWQNDDGGKQLFEDFAYQISMIKNFAPVDFVIHTATSRRCEYSKIGEERLKKLIEIAKQNGVRICVENTFTTKQQKAIFENIIDENLKMCYDAGHENWLTPNDKLVDNFKDKIVKMHLHSNDGIYDWHMPIFEGKMDYKTKAKDLAKLDNVPLCLEIKLQKIIPTVDILKGYKNDLDLLEKYIEDYKKDR